MVQEKTKDELWNEMDDNEKRKWNGHDGFCNNAYFSSGNAFMQEDKAKLKKRSEKELDRRHKNG